MSTKNTFIHLISLLLVPLFVLPAVVRAVEAKEAVASSAVASREMVVDFSKPMGKIRPLNGVNNGPANLGLQVADMESRHREAAFPSVRLHDCYWPNPSVVDVPAIFPLFYADADNPTNYIFAPTDRYLAPIAARGVQIVYRLGVSIEHKTAFHIQPPADFEKWAKICVNIIRHTNDGWANGTRYNIKHFEIWNEPDIGRMMWRGTPEQYFELYKVAVKALKAYNPDLKIGNQFAQGDGKFATNFLAYCRDQKLPLDFFSYHSYAATPMEFTRAAMDVRRLVDEYGFKKAELFCTEWKPMVAGFKEVEWKPGRPAGRIRAAFARNRNHEAAACAASTLMLLQDTQLDMAHYYTADNSPWGMFDEYGEPGKVFFAFKAFNQLLQTPNRVHVSGVSSNDQVTACGGIADDGKSAGLLLSNFKGQPANLQISLKDFPLEGELKAESFIVDEGHDYTPLETRSLSETNRMLACSLPPATVMLVRFSQQKKPEKISPPGMAIKDRFTPLPGNAVQFHGCLEGYLQKNLAGFNMGKAPYTEFVQYFRTGRPQFALGELWGKSVLSRLCCAARLSSRGTRTVMLNLISRSPSSPRMASSLTRCCRQPRCRPLSRCKSPWSAAQSTWWTTPR